MKVSISLLVIIMIVLISACGDGSTPSESTTVESTPSSSENITPTDTSSTIEVVATPTQQTPKQDNSLDDFEYSFTDHYRKEYRIDNYSGISNEVNIPAIINDVPVTEIGKGVFEGRTDIISVTFPDGFKKIGERAFMGCIGLTSISFPDSLSYIDNSAFENCTSLTSLYLPDNVGSVEKPATY